MHVYLHMDYTIVCFFLLITQECICYKLQNQVWTYFLWNMLFKAMDSFIKKFTESSLEKGFISQFKTVFKKANGTL